MKWSLMIGNFWGTKIHLHLSMLLIIPYVVLTFRPEDLTGALRLLLLIAAIFVCVALHELGHTVAARLFGIQVNSIVLWPLGGFANLSSRPEKVLHDIVISAAGPFTNLVIFAILLVVTIVERLIETRQLFPEVSSFLWSANVFPFLVGLTLANLILALFNLVPVYPLDGGQIARGLLKLVFGEKYADTIMLVVSLPLALALTIYGLYLRDVIVILTGMLLLLAASTLNTRLYNNLAVWFLYFIDRGSYYIRQRDFDSAIPALDKAIKRAPNQTRFYVSRAVAYMNIGESSLAKADVDHALALDAKNYIAWALRGEILSMDNQYQPALQAFNRSIEINPTWAMAYMDRGILQQEQGNLAEALEDMDRAVELGQGYILVYTMRSRLRYQLGDISGARSDNQKALRYSPPWMLSMPEFFLIHLKGHLNWALEYYWQAIQQMPNTYQAYQGRADACRVNNRLDWAIADYNRAIQLAPRQAELYMGRGRCYMQLGYLQYAQADYRQAVQFAGQSHIRRRAEKLLNQVEHG
jgi:tetratricopeptide (TPR) repeat protein